MAMGLWGLLAPLWWPWYCASFLLSHSWALAVFIAAASTLFLVFRWRSDQKSTTASKWKGARVVSKPTQLVQEVLQVLPVHPHNGWALDAVSDGVCVFMRFFPSLGLRNTPCLAASALIDASTKKLLTLATNDRDIPNWIAGVTTPPQYIQRPQVGRTLNADIINLTFERRGSRKTWAKQVIHSWRQLVTQFTQKYATFLDGVVSIPTNIFTEVFDREWGIDREGCGYVCWVTRQPSQLPYLWSLLLFNPLPKERGLSVATLIMLPRSFSSLSSTSSCLTSHLVALQHFISLRRARVYSSALISTNPIPRSTVLEPVGHVTSLGGHVTSAPGCVASFGDHVTSHVGSGEGLPDTLLPSIPPLEQRRNDIANPVQPVLKSGGRNSSHVTGSVSDPPSLPPPSSSPPLPPPPPDPSSPYAHLEPHYLELGIEACRKLVDASKATVKDGWISVGLSKKGVFVMKRPSQSEEVAVNCVKGKTLINAPMEFVFRILRNVENNSILEDMLRETRVTHRLSDTTILVHLLYKPVWPTAARDFTAISMAGCYDSHTLVEAGVSIVDPRMPEEKGYVRGNIICGGYVVTECPHQREQCEATYVSHVELKGNIPTFVVNKVTESQPQCVLRLKTLAEKRYSELKGSPQKMKEFEESVILASIHPPPPPPPPPQSSPSPTAPPPSLIPSATVPVTFRASDGVSPGDVIDGERGGGGGGGGGGGEGLIFEDIKGVGEGEKGRHVQEQGRRDWAGDRAECEEEEEEEEEGGRIGEEREELSKYPALNAAALPHERESPDQETAETTLATWAVLTNSVATAMPGVKVGVASQEDGLLVMEALEAYTPEQISSDEEGGEEERDGVTEKGEQGTVQGSWEREESRRVHYEKNLPPYKAENIPEVDPLVPATEESISYPRQENGGVDYRTLGNQTAARVLEELFHISNINISNPSTFRDQESGWKLVSVEKDILIMKKKTPGEPIHSVMGKGIISLAPQEVYDSIRNPQLRFTYDSMLKELHIVKRVEDGLYVLHVHHETTQCFLKQSRDFCILVNERTEGNKLLLVGMSVSTPECPVNPLVTRGKITYSGWVIEPRMLKGKLCTEVTYLLQIDLGGVPATLVNHISKRQPLVIAYLRDYLLSTSPKISSQDSTASY